REAPISNTYRSGTEARVSVTALGITSLDELRLRTDGLSRRRDGRESCGGELTRDNGCKARRGPQSVLYRSFG
ncbi:hypothetical protein CRG98_042874, partial [Punica granatum]